MKHPYSAPRRLSPALARVRAYWEGLLRGNADMPFWDDVRLADLPDIADRLMLIDVFDLPERFRFSTIGARVTDRALAGKFIDEADLGAPFEFLRSQCSATVEAAAPTLFRADGDGQPAFSRLLLPLWGEGRIGMLLGAYDFA